MMINGDGNITKLVSKYRTLKTHNIITSNNTKED